jgi:hypothetical protein
MTAAAVAAMTAAAVEILRLEAAAMTVHLAVLTAMMRVAGPAVIAVRLKSEAPLRAMAGATGEIA